MTYVAEALIPTGNAKKYAIQLGKHWGHNLNVEEIAEAFVITFPKDARGVDWPGDALVTLAPEADALRCRIVATAEGQRDALKGAVDRHVDRFAFRECLEYNWSDKEA